MKQFFSNLWRDIKNGNVFLIIFGAAIGVTIVFTAFNRGARYGYVRGYGDGVDKTLDTVSTIVQRQISSDTSVTTLTIESTDTLKVTLSRKTLLPSDK